MSELSEFFAMVDRVERAIATIPAKAGVLAVNFSKDRFREQAWVDTTTEPWPKRKAAGWGRRERRGRAILVDSGRLRRSIRVVMVSGARVVVGVYVPYAKAHNDGFKGTVTQRVAAYRYSRYGTEKRGTGVYSIKSRRESMKAVRVQMGEVSVRAHTRTIHQRIPRRRFIGQSAVLDRNLQRMMTAELTKAIRA